MLYEVDLINRLSSLVNIKDVNSRFVALSAGVAKLTGLKSSEDVIGKTDHDIPCGVADFADEFIRMDKVVLKSKEKMIAMDIQHYSAGWGILMAEKVPILNDNNESIAIYSHCIDLSACKGFNSMLELYTMDTKLIGKSKKPASYILTGCHSPLSLTQKQENCLFYLIRGKSVKEISKIFKISPRTVESHIKAIKFKLNCKSIPDIIEKAIDSGFLYYVPVCIQKVLNK